MTIPDAWLLTKKVAVGIVVTIVPLAILTGGLWLTQRRANNHTQVQQSSAKQVMPHAN
jgi:hypothetical protein